jgi:hypothetical protein
VRVNGCVRCRGLLEDGPGEPGGHAGGALGWDELVDSACPRTNRCSEQQPTGSVMRVPHRVCCCRVGRRRTMAQQWDSPGVSTVAALSVGATGAALSATVNPQNLATGYHFDYGTTISYGSQTTAQSVGSDAFDHAVLGTASGLVPNTAYHFRVVASNAVGTGYGHDQTFTTQPSSSSQPASLPAPSAPVNSVSPSIVGTPRPGAVLTCSPGSWSGALSLAYEWLRDGAPISHARAPTLRLGSTEVAHRIACRVTAGNSTGSTSATSATIRVVDLAPPRLSDLKLSPTRFTAATTGPSILTSGKRGTRVTFTLNEQATVTFRVQHLQIGRRLSGRCRARIDPNRKAKRCILYVIIKGGFTWSGQPGPTTFRSPAGSTVVGSRRATTGSQPAPATRVATSRHRRESSSRSGSSTRQAHGTTFPPLTLTAWRIQLTSRTRCVRLLIRTRNLVHERTSTTSGGVRRPPAAE